MKNFWKKLWDLLSAYHKTIAYVLAIISFVEILNLTGPYLVKLIIDAIGAPDGIRIDYILKLVIAMFVINEINSLIMSFSMRKTVAISVRMVEELSKRAHTKMVFLGLKYHEAENTGSKIFRIQKGINMIDRLMDDIYWQVAPTLIQVFLTTIALFWVDWRFGGIFLIFIPIFLLITAKLNKTADPYRKKIHNDYEAGSGKMAQAIININTVKSFAQERKEEKIFGTLAESASKNVKKMFYYIFNYNLGRDFVINFGEALIILSGVYFVSKGQITIGSLVFTITIAQKALTSLYRISRIYDRIMDSSEAVDRLHTLLNEKDDIFNKENGLKPKNIRGNIVFDNVCFNYGSDKNNVLKNINLKLTAGKTVAFVGPSGSGKTTITRLIYRHYDPRSGSILLDGHDIRDYDIYALRRFFAIVPQEVDIFNASISENIAYSKPNASFAEIKKAAIMANADEFIQKMPEQYKTVVGERGMKLSGGQRQRIGIARAILSNPKILIFDEATSNLDSKSEQLIQKSLTKISKNRTTIIIAHRLSTIREADEIVVLENGKIKETGTHKELSNHKKGLYADLLKLQKMGEIE